MGIAERRLADDNWAPEMTPPQTPRKSADTPDFDPFRIDMIDDWSGDLTI
jgi:hypothetical protein